MVLMKDPDSFMTPTKPSYFYVSRDYGKTYENITSNFTLGNGTLVVISDFFSSTVNHRNYILVAKFHHYIFTSNDECRSFRRVSTYFYPSEVKFHPHMSYYVAVHEKDMGSQRVSCNFVFDLFECLQYLELADKHLVTTECDNVILVHGLELQYFEIYCVAILHYRLQTNCNDYETRLKFCQLNYRGKYFGKIWIFTKG